MKNDRFRYEHPNDCENIMTAVVDESNQILEISVSEERAVDSYNEIFECTISLNKAEATKLRDWLNGVL